MKITFLESQSRVLPTLLCLGLLSTSVLAQTITNPGNLGPRSRAASPIVGVEITPGLFDLHSLSSDLSSAHLLEAGIEFLPLDLVGQRVIDHFRLDRPTQQEETGVPSWISLPNGDNLYMVARGTRVGLLLIPAAGRIRWVAAIDNAASTDAISDSVAISLDGRWLVYGTDVVHGGNLYEADLLRGGMPVDLTADIDPISYRQKSVRNSSIGVWWVTGDELWTASRTTQATEIALPLTGQEGLHQDLVMSDQGNRVAVITEEDPTTRRVLVVDLDGTVYVAVATPQPIELPGTTEPLGPFMALSHDGQRLAWLSDGPPQELFITQVQSTPIETHITLAPDFPIYIDNIGVIGFASPQQVCYLAGDVVLAVVDDDDLIGAADMYATVTDAQGIPTTWNLTRTSGVVWPPFDVPATLSVSDAYLDHNGERFLIQAEFDDTSELASFVIYTGGYYHSQSNIDVLLSDLEEDPELYMAGRQIMVTSVLNGTNDVQVHRIDPVSGTTQQATLVGIFAPGTTLRAVRSRGGDIAFVAVGATDDAWVSSARGTHGSWLPGSFAGQISSTLGLLPGARLLLGLSLASGADQPVVVDNSASVQALPLPSLPCRVLR
jgi:hypothetical protein